MNEANMGDSSPESRTASEKEFVSLVLDLALLIDELSVTAEKKESSPTHLSFFRDRLIEILESHGAEVINDTLWNPLRQRAEKLTPIDLQPENAVIAETISSGVALAGKVIKKQSVSLRDGTQN